MPDLLKDARRVVLKLGTHILINADGSLATDRLQDIITQVVALIADGKELLIVTSGAVGLGKLVLARHQPPLDISKDLTMVDKQACAAVGQNLLMEIYRDYLNAHGLTTAQILLVSSDFADRQRYLNIQATLERLLELRAIPVINENDVVSTMELESSKGGRGGKSFGDNDKLSALVASKLHADLLLILTNVDGIYTANPLEDPEARKIDCIDGLEQLQEINTAGQSTMGRGGMSTKIEACRIAAMSGVNTLIISGFETGAIRNALTAHSTDAPNPPGTLVLAKSSISNKKHWIGFASGFQGVVVVNEGAKRAMMDRHASLLPIGIVKVQGDFTAKQVVLLQDEAGNEFGRGIVNFSALDVKKIMGHNSVDVTRILGDDDVPIQGEVIDRDNLVIFTA
ncbi:MAG: glutamate 5-kinase [Candidatus Melainabacteria bacterium]